MPATVQTRWTAQERTRLALKLRAGGATYRQIAVQVGYANPGTVHRIVSRALAAIPKDAADELRVIELERLDEMQLALTRQLRTGDVSVVPMLLRVSDQRCRLTGLYRAEFTEEGVDVREALRGLLADAEAAANDAEEEDCA